MEFNRDCPNDGRARGRDPHVFSSSSPWPARLQVEEVCKKKSSSCIFFPTPFIESLEFGASLIELTEMD